MGFLLKIIRINGTSGTFLQNIFLKQREHSAVFLINFLTFLKERKSVSISRL